MIHELYARKLRKYLLKLNEPCKLSRDELEQLGWTFHNERRQFQKILFESYDFKASGSYDYLYYQVEKMLKEYREFSQESNVHYY